MGRLYPFTSWVANVDEWLARKKTQEEIQEFIEKQGYDQTVALAVYAQNRPYRHHHPRNP